MNKEKLIWGFTLAGVGLILLLNNMDVIDFHWRAVFRMWPLIIIVVGVNLLLSRSAFGQTLSVIVTIASIAFLAYVGINAENSRGWNLNSRGWGDSSRSVDRGNRNYFKNTSTYEYEERINTAKLNIRGGAVEYDIDGPDNDYLFWSENESSIAGHQLGTRELNDSTVQLDFQMKDSKDRSWNFGSDKNEAKIKLHSSPVWSINLNMGAGTADFDLREYKISSLEMQCGAASIEAKLGQPYGHSEVRVESGAASIEIEVPESAACRIVTSSALSSKDFKGFTKQADGSYTTPGYGQQEDRYTIHLKGGVSSFAVKRKSD